MIKKIFLFVGFVVLFFLSHAVSISYSFKAHPAIDSIYIFQEVDSVIINNIPDSLKVFSSSNILIQQSKLIVIFSNNQTFYQVTLFHSEKSTSFFKQYIIIKQPSNWWFRVLIGIIGGLGLFLFGINYMSDGFIKWTGNRIHNVIKQVSDNPFKAIGIGMFLTVITQSSSAVSIFLIKLIKNKLITFKQTVGIIVGAAFGTTITLQIIALQINTYALVFIGVGFILIFISKTKKNRRLGQIITGLGLLYLGLLIMSQSAIALKNLPSVVQFFAKVENPAIAILIGILFTVITQSASAFIGILIMLGNLHLISLEASIALFIGSNIGTSFPVMLAVVKNEAGTRAVALFHLFYRIVGAILFVFWIPTFALLVKNISSFVAVTVTLPHLIANAHTLMYVILTLFAIPLLPLFYSKIKTFSKVDTEKPFFFTKYINEDALNTPDIFIILVKKEIVHMANVVLGMIKNILPVFLVKDQCLYEQLKREEQLVNFLQDKITQYLIRYNKQSNLYNEQLHESYKLLAIVKELEEIADIINTNLLPKAKNWIEKTYDFSDEGKKELNDYHQRCVALFSKVIDAMINIDEGKAKRIQKEEKENIKRAYELDQKHFARLLDEVEKTVQSSKTHIELIGMMQAINRHSVQIIRILYNN